MGGQLAENIMSELERNNSPENYNKRYEMANKPRRGVLFNLVFSEQATFIFLKWPLQVLSKNAIRKVWHFVKFAQLLATPKSTK